MFWFLQNFVSAFKESYRVCLFDCLLVRITKTSGSQLPVVAQFISASFHDALRVSKDGGRRKMKQLAYREKITEESQA